MAIWQFKISVIPTSGIIACYGKLVDSLPEYKTRSGDEPVKELDDFFNYWQGMDLTSEKFQEITQLLPEKESWSDDARMFGNKGEDEIEIWDDDINCSFDVRKVNIELLTKVVEFARKSDCKIVTKDNGIIIEPEMQMVITALNNSNAIRFLNNPIIHITSKPNQ